MSIQKLSSRLSDLQLMMKRCEACGEGRASPRRNSSAWLYLATPKGRKAEGFDDLDTQRVALALS